MTKFSSSTQSYNTDRQDGRAAQIRSQQGTATLRVEGVSDEVEGPGRRMQRIHNDPSGVKLSGLIPMLLNARPQALEACALGSETAEGPLARSRTPSSQQEPGCSLEQTPQRLGAKSAKAALPDSQGQRCLWLWELGLGISLLNEQSLNIRWLSARLISSHLKSQV